MLREKIVKPLGPTSPWVFVVEPVHGCNLRCGHCSCRLDEPGKRALMRPETWEQTWRIIATWAPTCRVDLCLGGEPTLHPSLPDFLRTARRISPRSQIQITTNGTIFRKGAVGCRELLLAGANVLYVDMYGPREEFVAMARDSGFPWYEYYRKPAGAPSPWTYHGPSLKLIVLQEQPENWPRSRFRAGLLGTWYNHLDWEAAARFGLSPVTEPLARRCNQPFLYACVDAAGKYLLCCQDNTGETSGLFGGVDEGADGFPRFWYGRELQTIRARLRQKNRRDTSYCSRCCITFSRCDFLHWTDDQVGVWWDGRGWRKVSDG